MPGISKAPVAGVVAVSPLQDAIAPPPSVAIIPGALSKDECEKLHGYLDEGASMGALAGGHMEYGVRDCTIRWLDDGPEFGWLFERIARLTADVQRSHYDYILHGFDEGIQLIRYHPSNIAYDWHIDCGHSGTTQSRKLSLSIQLSDEEDYSGGALELNPAGHVIDAPKAQGTAIFFPSFTLHRVAPIVSGERISLVAWVHGPRFR